MVRLEEAVVEVEAPQGRVRGRDTALGCGRAPACCRGCPSLCGVALGARGLGAGPPPPPPEDPEAEAEHGGAEQDQEQDQPKPNQPPPPSPNLVDVMAVQT
jgi:hypothetical protein